MMLRRSLSALTTTSRRVLGSRRPILSVRHMTVSHDDTRTRIGYDTYTNEILSNMDLHRSLVELNGAHPIISCDCYIAPSATLAGDVTISDLASVGYNCVLRGDLNEINVGANTTIQEGTVVSSSETGGDGYDGSVNIGNWTIIGTGCSLDACNVGDEVVVGAGCMLAPGSLMEKQSVLLPGSVLGRNARVPSGEVYGGNPAVKVRDLSKDEIEHCRDAAERVWKAISIHRDEFLPYSTIYQHLEKKGVQHVITDPAQ